MRPDLEDDFRDQQTRLLVLLDSREGLADGSPEADESDKKIRETQGLLLSYEALKWFEREG